MNTGMAISFVIGGLLLISVISLNSRVMENSGEAVLNMSAKQKVETVTKVMNRDFQRIAFNTGDDEPNDAIVDFEADTINKKFFITFTADLDDANTDNPVTITWKTSPSDSITSTENPNDYRLKRIVDDGNGSTETYEYSVTDFSFTFYNEGSEKELSEKTESSELKIIDVFMQAEAAEKYGNRSDYEISIWEKTFTPPNLNMYNYNL